MKGSLFREEAFKAQLDGTNGQVVLARSISTWYFCSGAIGIALLILVLLFFGEYTKRTATVGLLVPSEGAIRIIPPVGGVVLESRVIEGQSVRHGDVLFVVGDARNAVLKDSSLSLGDTVSRNIQHKRSELERSRDNEQLTARLVREGQASKIQKLTVELNQTEREIVLDQSRVYTAQKNIERYVVLLKSNFVSAQAVQQKEDELADAEARLVGVERARTALQNEIAMAENEIKLASSREATRMAEINRDLAGLEQEQVESSAKYRYEITAPVNGVVTAILASRGQVIINQPMATLLPNGGMLEAQLFIPSKAAGFIESGHKVRLRFQAYPYQKFGQYEGAVSQVSRSQIEPNDLPSTLPFPATQAREGLYRISVKLRSQSVFAYGKSTPLVAGMIVDADIEQDTRRLIEWVLEPLYALKGKIS
jgi:membrane fusion protein